MAKRVNTAIIGAFVIGAIVLFLVSVIIFSSGTLSKRSVEYILFFDETVSGLSVGAPVKFRGVEIGAVKSVVLLADIESQEVDIPIIIEIDPAKFKSKSEQKVEFKGGLELLIEKGLRARLDIQSIVTGQSYIQIDFMPDTPFELKGADLGYKEIPTVKSSFTKLSETLQDLPFRSVLTNLEEVVVSINELIEKGELDTLLKNINLLIVHADQMVANMNSETSALALEAGDVLDEAAAAMNKITADIDSLTANTNALIVNVNEEVDPLAKELHDTLAALQVTLSDMSNTLATADKFINESDVRFRLVRALEEAGSAARSIRELTEYLERHPEAFLQGRSPK